MYGYGQAFEATRDFCPQLLMPVLRNNLGLCFIGCNNKLTDLLLQTIYKIIYNTASGINMSLIPDAVFYHEYRHGNYTCNRHCGALL